MHDIFLYTCHGCVPPSFTIACPWVSQTWICHTCGPCPPSQTWSFVAPRRTLEKNLKEGAIYILRKKLPVYINRSMNKHRKGS